MNTLNAKETNDTTRQSYLEHVKTIESMESDVDKLLSAARLSRVESGKNQINTTLRIAAMLAISAVLCVIFILMGDSKSAEFVYMILGSGGIVAICGALFYTP